jgi:hypothetical protein
MKLNTILNYAGWASGIFGGIMLLCGVIGFFTGNEFLGVRYYYNFFFYGNSFIFFGIFLLIGTKCCCCCCKDDKYSSEEKK